MSSVRFLHAALETVVVRILLPLNVIANRLFLTIRSSKDTNATFAMFDITMLLMSSDKTTSMPLQNDLLSPQFRTRHPLSQAP